MKGGSKSIDARIKSLEERDNDLCNEVLKLKEEIQMKVTQDPFHALMIMSLRKSNFNDKEIEDFRKGVLG